MEIKFDIVISTPEQSVDMKTGLESMLGVSDATRYIAETLLTGRVPERISHKGKVRTNLKKTFKGSFGQAFDLEVYDDRLARKLRAIGRMTFVELMQYFFQEAMYTEANLATNKAQSVMEKLGGSAESLIKQLRRSALENIHQVSTKLDREITIRFRKNTNTTIEVARFNKVTAGVLKAEEDKKVVDLVVAVTRLNIRTGNGRFLPVGEPDTIAFGFGIEYEAVRLEAKKLFSENLDHNNGLKPSEYKTVKISAIPVRLKDGKIIKYIVKGFYSA